MRLGLVRAMLMCADILLLDEPTGGCLSTAVKDVAPARPFRRGERHVVGRLSAEPEQRRPTGDHHRGLPRQLLPGQGVQPCDQREAEEAASFKSL